MPTHSHSSLLNNVVSTAFTLLISWPATILTVGVVLALLTSQEPLAKEAVIQLVKFQAAGADSEPNKLHLQVCETSSPVAIMCDSTSVKAYSIEEATKDLTSMAIRTYAALFFASLLLWVVTVLPARIHAGKAYKMLQGAAA